MKLYVKNSDNNQKVYLNLTATTRNELAKIIGGNDFFLADKKYSVDEVEAEREGSHTATGTIVGGVVGALGGPIGIIIGGILGGLFGSASEEERIKETSLFNNS